MASATMTLHVRSHKLVASQPPLPAWPDAEQCCSGSDLDHPEPGKRCWVIQGVAAGVCSPIENQVINCLTEREEDLYKRRKSSLGYSVKCYMAGTEKTTSRPVAVIACTSKSFGKRIQTLIESEPWWLDFRSEYRAFGGFLHAKRQPSHYADNSGPGEQIRAYVSGFDTILLGSVLYTLTARDSKPRQSILGGFLLVDKMFCGLTVSHVFFSNLENQSAALDPLDSESPSDSEDSDGDGSVTTTESNALTSVSSLSLEVSALDINRPGADYTMIGTIDNRSAGGPDDRLDWAIVKLNSLPLSMGDDAYTEIGDLSQGLVSTVFLVQNGKILAEGTVCGTPSIVCLPRSRRPMFLYSMATTERLRPGDSGTWVVDKHGNWYGHVIAGEPGTNIVYIAAASQIIDDLKQRYRTEEVHVFKPLFANSLPGINLMIGTDVTSSSFVTTLSNPGTTLERKGVGIQDYGSASDAGTDADDDHLNDFWSWFDNKLNLESDFTRLQSSKHLQPHSPEVPKKKEVVPFDYTVNMAIQLHLKNDVLDFTSAPENELLQKLAETKKLHGIDSEPAVEVIHELANFYYNMGQLASAAQMYNRVIVGRQKVHESERLSSIHALSRLGDVYVKQGRLAEAELLYEEAVDVRKTMFGPKHATTLHFFESLGHVYTCQGRLTEAEHIYEEAVTRRREAFGHGHRSTLRAIRNLGKVYADMGRLDEAAQLYGRILVEGKETLSSADFAQTFDQLDELGDLYKAEQRVADATRMFEVARFGRLRLSNASAPTEDSKAKSQQDDESTQRRLLFPARANDQNRFRLRKT